MTIDLSKIDKEQFNINKLTLNNENCYLIIPKHFNIEWNKNNLIFRSIICNNQGEIISAGFKKFSNIYEKVKIFDEPPEDITGWKLISKEDGSLIILSKYKGEYIIRTRNSINTCSLKNSNEIDIFKSNIVPILESYNSNQETWDKSYLFEWKSPTHTIVISSEQVQFIFIGIVNHSDYTFEPQNNLDTLAIELNFKRPESYTFSSNKLKDIVNIVVNKWENTEGLVLYSPCGQRLYKIKSLWYLQKFREKSDYNTIEKIIDLWLKYERDKDINILYSKINSYIDEDILKEISEPIKIIINASNEIDKELNTINDIVSDIKSTRYDRKTIAIEINKKLKNKSSIGFLFLDNKPIPDKNYKKLLIEKLKL